MNDVLVIDATSTPIAQGSQVHDVLVFSPTLVGAATPGGADTQFVIFDVATSVGASTALASDFIIWDSNPPPVAQMDTGVGDFIIITGSGPKGLQGIQGIRGLQGIQGVPGDPVGAVSYTFTQLGAATPWDIYYPLAYEPCVMTVESGGAEVMGDITRITLGHLSVAFSQPISGVAYLS